MHFLDQDGDAVGQYFSADPLGDRGMQGMGLGIEELIFHGISLEEEGHSMPKAGLKQDCLARSMGHGYAHAGHFMEQK
jgi:hypothetical protein